MKPLFVRKELMERKIRIFTIQEFIRIFNLSPYQAEYSLRQLVNDGLLVRLKKGVYTLSIDPPSEEEVANVLYKPSYVSFEYALSYYGIIPETVYQITSATTKSTRLFTVGHNSFAYFTIKKKAYTGYILAQRGEKRFYIAEPEKALVDYLYAISLGKRALFGDKSINDRLELKSLDKEKILAFAGLYDWQELDKLVKEVLWFRKNS